MPLNIVIAPDSFKESLTAKQVCQAIKAGFQQVFTDATYVQVPMADGGEGTVSALVEATLGRYCDVEVLDALSRPITATYGWLGDSNTAVIEVAAASGLDRIERHLRDAKITSSYGTGQLIRDALEHGAKHIILGLGGSATNDAGAGMLTALGYRLLNSQGEPIGQGGAALSDIADIDTSQALPALKHCQFTIASDVDNPLCGKHGASAVFAPQKGASDDDVHRLDQALAHFADVLARQFACDYRNHAGAGAAGGLAIALMSAVQAERKAGSELIIDYVHLDAAIKEADLLITGEGKIDGQSIYGKTPIAVARLGQRHNVATIAICGTTGDGFELVYQHGIDAIFTIVNQPQTLTEALESGYQNMLQTSERVARSIKLGIQLGQTM